MFVRVFGEVRNVRGDRRGAAAMDFALVAPLLFSMILGAVEFGFVFYGLSAMQYGTNSTTQAIAINAVAIEQAQTTVNRYLPASMAAATATVRRSYIANSKPNSVRPEGSAPAGSTIRERTRLAKRRKTPSGAN